MEVLKQSTSYTWKAGPFLDDGDGKTAEPALTISQADIRLSKNGGNYAQTNNAAGATHDEGGEYDVPLNTTDTNTLGKLKVRIHEAGALPVWETFMVVPAHVYDGLFNTTDKLQVDIVQCGGSAVASGAIPNATADASGGLLTVDGTNDTTVGDDTLTDTAAINVNTYAAKLDVRDNASGSENIYSVFWFKNLKLLKSGVTLPKIWVFDHDDNDHIGTDGSPASMTEVGAHHTFKYEASGGQLMTSGEMYTAEVRATIDGSEWEWREVVGRDSSA